MHVAFHASATDCPLPKFGIVTIGHGHLLALTILIGPRPLHDDPIAVSISAPHRVAARLVVGPDDVRDVGVGKERYDTVAPSRNGVASKSRWWSFQILPGPEVSSPGERPRAPSESPYVADSAPAPDKIVRPTVSSEKLENLTIDAIAHRDETDHRIGG